MNKRKKYDKSGEKNKPQRCKPFRDMKKMVEVKTKKSSEQYLMSLFDDANMGNPEKRG